MTATGPGWPAGEHHRRRGRADELHRLDLPVGPGPAVWLLQVERPALVVGSAQAAADVDATLAARLGLEVVRRRSGGGAVVLVPDEVVWCDLVLPAGDGAVVDDVGEQFVAAGERWRAALSARGPDVGRLVVQPASTRPGPQGRVVCFGGLGPGEVVRSGRPAGGTDGGSGMPPAQRPLDHPSTAKLVGLSQRRTRAGVRVQGLVHRTFDADRTARLVAPGLQRLGLDPDEVAARLAREVAVADVDDAALADALARLDRAPGSDGPDGR